MTLYSQLSALLAALVNKNLKAKHAYFLITIQKNLIKIFQIQCGITGTISKPKKELIANYQILGL